MIVGPSRTTQRSGTPLGLLGLRRYCQSHRRRLAAAASAPKTRRYSASTPRWSSGRYRSISGMNERERNYRSACGGRLIPVAGVAAGGGGGGARPGRDAPTGTFHGFDGVGAGAAGGGAFGSTSGRMPVNVAPPLGAGTVMSPAAAAAAIAGSSCGS